MFQYSCRVTSDQLPAAEPRDRLGAAVRALADVVVRSGAQAEQIEAAAAAVEAIAADLGAHPEAAHVHDSPFTR
jgi:hypothetical protein